MLGLWLALALGCALAGADPAPPRASEPPQTVEVEAPPAAPRIFIERVTPPPRYAEVYREVERCSGRTGNFKAVKWGVMAGPVWGPLGATLAFTYKNQIVQIAGDTTYLRHEVMHHVLLNSGWRPAGARGADGHYTQAQLHPAAYFTRCVPNYDPRGTH